MLLVLRVKVFFVVISWQKLKWETNESISWLKETHLSFCTADRLIRPICTLSLWRVDPIIRYFSPCSHNKDFLKTDLLAEPISCCMGGWTDYHPLGPYSTEHQCCHSSLLGYWAQSWTRHHSNTAYSNGSIILASWYSFFWPQKYDRLSQPHLVLIQQPSRIWTQEPRIPSH